MTQHNATTASNPARLMAACGGPATGNSNAPGTRQSTGPRLTPPCERQALRLPPARLETHESRLKRRRQSPHAARARDLAFTTGQAPSRSPSNIGFHGSDQSDSRASAWAGTLPACGHTPRSLDLCTDTEVRRPWPRYAAALGRARSSGGRCGAGSRAPVIGGIGPTQNDDPRRWVGPQQPALKRATQGPASALRPDRPSASRKGQPRASAHQGRIRAIPVAPRTSARVVRRRLWCPIS